MNPEYMRSCVLYVFGSKCNINYNYSFILLAYRLVVMHVYNFHFAVYYFR